MTRAVFVVRDATLALGFACGCAPRPVAPRSRPVVSSYRVPTAVLPL